jgi:hypothetical protein
MKKYTDKKIYLFIYLSIIIINSYYFGTHTHFKIYKIKLNNILSRNIL